MPKLRVHEVAKQFNKTSTEILAALKQHGIEVKSHMSTVTEEEVAKIKPFFQKTASAVKTAPDRKAAPSKGSQESVKAQENQAGSSPKKADKPDEGKKAQTAHRENHGGGRQENRGQNRSEGRDGRDGRSDNRDNRGEGRDNRSDNRDNRSRRQGQENRGQNRSEGRDSRDGRSDNRDNRGRRQDGRDNRNRRSDNVNKDGRNGGRFENRNRSEGRTNDGNRARKDGENNRNSFNRGSDGQKKSFNNRGGDAQSRENKAARNSDVGGRFTKNGKDNRHDINREHSRDNRDNRDSRNSDSRNKNSRKNKNNDFGNTMSRKPKNAKKPPVVQPPKKEEPKEEVIRNITLPDPVSLKELAEACKITPAVIIKKLFLAGKMVTINTEFSFDEAAEIALEYNCIAEEEVKVDVIEELLKEDEEDESKMVSRPPVICVMGHVDHGKTSLLDCIRSTHVTAGEAGGITQHIGAYVVDINGEKITFLDTPGHEAFTSMRLRGAQATDIAVLVVAADDGVMPQTIEAINHAKAAEVEVIVAVNKIDKEGANIDRVKQELTEYGLIAEDWGGSTVFVPVSAKTGEGIDDLLEMITLTAEVLELKANPKRKARGLVIEAKLDKGRGPVATILIQKGTLKVGDTISIGHTFGRVRAMIDDKGNRVKTAGPSVPVEILGLNDVPFSGEVMMAHDNEKDARATAEAFIAYGREKMLEETKSKLSLDDLFDQIQAGNVKELNLVVKADVQGSVEAVKQSLMKLSNDEVMIKVIHGGVGAINESDVMLASASNAIIIGFNIRPDATAKSTAEREKVDMRLYRVIYNAIEDIEAAMKGMLDPVYEEKVIGHLEVRQIYKASGVGTIAGCYVSDGMVTRASQVRIVRDGVVIYEGTLASLKRFKDDAKEVKAGFECGLVFEKFNDVKEGDKVESFVMEEIPR